MLVLTPVKQSSFESKNPPDLSEGSMSLAISKWEIDHGFFCTSGTPRLDKKGLNKQIKEQWGDFDHSVGGTRDRYFPLTLPGTAPSNVWILLQYDTFRRNYLQISLTERRVNTPEHSRTLQNTLEAPTLIQGIPPTLKTCFPFRRASLFYFIFIKPEW